MKLILPLLICFIFILAGCTRNFSESEIVQINENLGYGYSIKNPDNNVVFCFFEISKSKDFYFNISSSDATPISFGIFDVKRIEMEEVGAGLLEFKNAEAAYEDGYEYVGYLPLQAGQYELLISKYHAREISVSIKSSEELVCS
ncbi:MAG: hypothetical protein ABIH29_02645 [Candidatus Micrarchaeota archaeon]